MKRAVMVWMVCFFLAALPAISLAQAQEWSIIRLSGDTLAPCVLQSVHDSVLTIDSRGVLVSVPIDSVVGLFRHEPSHVLTGTVVGALGGVVIGALIGSATYEEPRSVFAIASPAMSTIGGGLLGLMGGSLVGAGIGAAVSADETYSLAGRSHNTKYMVFWKIIDEKK